MSAVFTESEVKHLMRECSMKIEGVVDGYIATLTNVQWGDPDTHPRIPIRIIAPTMEKADERAREILCEKLALGDACLMSRKKHSRALRIARGEDSE